MNAANAVLVPSEREGFGLAVLEALACDVPVLATPVGIHREALDEPRGHAVRPVSSWMSGGERSSRICAARIRGSTVVSARSATPRRAWASVWRRHGARSRLKAGSMG